jgi:hypothetical protein
VATDTKERDGTELSPDEQTEEEFNRLPGEAQEDIAALADAAGQTVEEYASSRGKTIEDLAKERGENGDEPEELAPMQIPLPGTMDTISASSEIRLLGGKMPLEGSFAQGEEFDVIVRVKVTGVLGQDTVDDWGRTTRTTRRHLARMLSVRRFSSA